MKHSIGQALRLLRVYSDYKLCKFSQQIGISKSYISEMENGKKVVGMRVLEKYSQFLKLPVSEIVKFSELISKRGIGNITQTVFRQVIQTIRNSPPEKIK